MMFREKNAKTQRERKGAIGFLCASASLRLCVEVFLPLATAQEPQEQQVPYVFESRVDMVSVAVAVTDEKGNFVTGLEAEDFTIFEDGVRQEIRLFAAGRNAT